MSPQSNYPGGPSTVDPAEVARFSQLSEEWWDPQGRMAPLHKINPLRLGWIRDTACRKFNRNPRSLKSLERLRVLDIGCGAGLLSEPLARLAHRSSASIHPNPTSPRRKCMPRVRTY
jgi:2-polyprenyl-6-hydroxyphenyl methylase/3-demethylubiquinone-9 3-methyltransferase